MTNEVDKHLRTIAKDLVETLHMFDRYENLLDTLTTIMRLAMQEAGVRKFEIDGAKLVLLKNGELSCSWNPSEHNDGETLH